MGERCDPTAAGRQARYRQKQAETGRQELRVWVTPDQAAAIRNFLSHSALLPPTPQPSHAVGAAVIEFSAKPSADLRRAMKEAGIGFNGAGQRGSEWGGKISAHAYAALLPAIEREGGSGNFTPSPKEIRP